MSTAGEVPGVTRPLQSGTPRSASIVRFEVLGPLCVRGRGLPPVTRRAQRRLLSILLLEADRCVTTGALVERLWSGRPPPTARTALQTHVSGLRRALPRGSIVTEARGYRVVTEGAGFDRTELEHVLASTHRAADLGRWDEVLVAADRASSLWRGRPFEELADDDVAQPEILRLDEMRVTTLELRAEALIEVGRAREAIPDLESTVRRFPLREGVSTLLARARQRTGSVADALRCLRRLEDALAELGLEPSPRLREVELDVLEHRTTPATSRRAGRRTA